MQATHKTSSSTCNVLLSSILLRSNRITLQTPVYRVFNHAIWPIKMRHSHSLCSNTLLAHPLSLSCRIVIITFPIIIVVITIFVVLITSFQNFLVIAYTFSYITFSHISVRLYSGSLRKRNPLLD